MMNMLKLLKGIFSLDTLIYLAILLILLYALMRCILPLIFLTGRLRRAARVIITENKQNKERNPGMIFTFWATGWRASGRISCRMRRCATRTARAAT